MISAVIFFLGGLALLLKGSDLFVDSSVRIAKYAGISEVVIGLTLVAVGTSLPELATSVTAAYYGNTGLAVGNVVGSNIANMGLILGICSFIAVLKLGEEVFYRDGFIMLGITLIFYWFASDGVISPLNGFVLLAVFGLYISYLFQAKPKFKNILRLNEFIYLNIPVERIFELGFYKKIVEKGLDSIKHRELVDRKLGLGLPESRIKKGFNGATYRRILVKYEEKLRRQTLKEVFCIIGGIVGIYFGSKYMISGAVDIASSLGIPENIVGFTLIAVGTSLPELFVSITSVKKGFGNIILGNVIGSNIANLSLVVGVSSFVSPIIIPETSISVTIPLMIILSFVTVLFIRSGWQVRRREGIFFLLSYASIIIWTLLRLR
ncbi:MAG: calcium/sodium antiporter [Methanobacteriota archaeon]